MSIRRCAGCAHSWVQHQDDDQGCWHPDCIDSPTRCQQFRGETASQIEAREALIRQPTVRTAASAPDTSHLAAEVAKLKVGTMKYNVYRSILFANADGRTDEELESVLCKPHQTVSAARNTLMNDDLIVDSGQRRKTKHGVDAIVWVVADA